MKAAAVYVREPTDTWPKAGMWKPISGIEQAVPKGARKNVMLYYNLDIEPTLIEEPFSERISFWEQLPLHEYEHERAQSDHYDYYPHYTKPA